MSRLAPGVHVGDRYRLEAELGGDEGDQVWRAFDERLERQVAVRVYGPDADVDRLAEQAGVAASLTHPRVVRLFDTGYHGTRFYTVSELLPGSLAWARLPLEGEEALDLAIHVCEALGYAHERGVAHGNLHAGNVLLSEQGAKVADFGLATDDASVGGDLEALAGLVREATRPRDGRPGTAPEVSEIVYRLRSGRYSSSRAVLADLTRLRAVEQAPTNRRSRVLVGGAAVLLVAAAVFAATRLGTPPASSPAATEPPRITGTPYDIGTVADFDPLGDGREGRSTVANVYDGDRQTFWSTERYSGGADFSGLKPGVGVILDLGSPRTVGQAQVFFAAAGCSFEIRHSDVRARSVDDWTPAARVDEAGRTGAVVFEPSTSRWWLVWITRLTEGVPGTRGGYACGVTEALLYPP